MTYEDALRFIHSSNMRGRKRPLAMTAELLSRVGSPERKLRFVHVAGTNGKGSVCAYIEAVLRRAGYKTGLFTSPFVERFNERIRVCGADMPDEDLAATLKELLPALEGLEIQPSEFELVTILGLMYFARRGCDIAVLEVGLGGALDATNVIPASEVSVITALGLDHTQYLGGTLREIAAAKAGIIKPHGRAVIYSDVDGVIGAACAAVGAELTEADFSRLSVHSFDITGSIFDYKDLNDLRTPLAGTYQPRNAALAIEAIQILREERGFKISDDDIRYGLSGTIWPGRFEIVLRKPIFIVDGGHNPHAVQNTLESLGEYFPDRRFIFLTGVMADKDVQGIVRAIVPAAERVVTLTPPGQRAMPAERYAEIFRSCGVEAEAARSVDDGVRRAVSLAGKSGAVCAIGSIYLISNLRQAVLNMSNKWGAVHI